MVFPLLLFYLITWNFLLGSRFVYVPTDFHYQPEAWLDFKQHMFLHWKLRGAAFKRMALRDKWSHLISSKSILWETGQREKGEKRKRKEMQVLWRKIFECNMILWHCWNWHFCRLPISYKNNVIIYFNHCNVYYSLLCNIFKIRTCLATNAVTVWLHIFS